MKPARRIETWVCLRHQEPCARARCVSPSGKRRVCSFCKHMRCRRARPMCKAMRLLKPNKRPCQCGGVYAKTKDAGPVHRTGSIATCIHHPNHAELAWAELEKPIRRTG